MYAKGCNVYDLAEAAARAGVKVDYEDLNNRIRFTLKLAEDKKFQKLRPSATMSSVKYMQVDEWKMRKTGNVCFHGHYRFLYELFNINPNAVVDSSLYGKVRYTADDFEEKAREYGMQPLGPHGNIYHVWQLRETCDCAENGIILESNNSPY